MFNESGKKESSPSSRRLVLAENYRHAPRYQNRKGGTVYDAPRRVSVNRKNSVVTGENAEVSTRVSEVLKSLR